MMILATLKINGSTDSYLFTSFSEYYEATFNPEIKIEYELIFDLTGKTYNEKKASAQNIAIDYSLATGNEIEPLSMNELSIISEWFARVGKHYGLLNEFRENAIC